jgi:hypothetical protein
LGKEWFIIYIGIIFVKLKDETCITTAFIIDVVLGDIGVEFLEEENEFGFVFAFLNLFFIKKLRWRRENIFRYKFKVRWQFLTVGYYTKNFS